MKKPLLYVLALGIFGIATTEFGVIGILPQIAASFHITIDKAGWLLSAFAIIIAVFAPFMMMLFSPFDRKKLLVLVVAVFAVSNIISAISPTFTILLLARMLPAFLHPVFWSIALATAANSVPEDQAPQAVSIVFAGFTIASVFGVPLATFVATIFNWQASFILSAAINIVSCLGVLLFLPNIPKQAPERSGSPGKVLLNKGLWISLLLTLLMVSAMYSTYSYMAEYLEKVTHMSNKTVSLMLLLFGITGIAGNWLAGKLMGKNIMLTIVGFIVALTLVHILIFYAGPSKLLMIITICLWGFVHTSGFLISNINVTSAVNEEPEFINSIFTSCGNLAVTLGALMGGYTIVHFSVQQIIWSSIVLLSLSFLAWILKKRYYIN
ncbi:MFS transporter [Mucilaginibacter gilvus]|uniref:MFS transporter n=1 Tax=Mucilaginibacter gilvus TaxID=2305909 RepID=A0A444MTG4_9SPHI|nr:MFS transporter [Mucilaginibacter gilvus]RWY55912.1 MFS transporter [Mucilaginibacter gilvus]